MKTKSILLTLAASLLALSARALNPGDLAFTTLNADEDGWAMVALAEIPTNTTVYFTDNEWDGTNFNSGEGYHQWLSGAAPIAPGTLIRFSAIDNITNLAASVGTLTRATVAGSINYGLSATEESVFAYQATAITNASTFIAAVCTTSFGTATAGVLTNTGLSVGNGAIQAAFAGGSDFLEYTNSRSGQASFAAYLPMVCNVTNWLVDTANGVFATTLPNTNAFTIMAGTPVVTISATDASASETAANSGTFRFSRTGDTTNPLNVSYAIASGAGQAVAADYTPSLTNSIVIPATQSFVDATITPVDDVIVEGNETVSLTLQDTVDYDLGGATNAMVTIADNETTINLANYVRIGRYNLPEPTRTTPPDSTNLLCQEASGVAYNWDTDTLFIIGDGGRSFTQVSKTGALIDTMTLALGGSPQGTDFYDPEGVTYIGGGQFVFSEERDRQIVKFTYAAGTVLSRSGAQTVDLGTFVPNIGIEGLSYDPQTSGFICVKESGPQGVFQTTADFVAGTASNGASNTVNSINLFDPVLLGFTDLADVFALSNLPGLTNTSDTSHLLVLSQEDARILNVDRSGNIYSSLQIVTDLGNPLNVASQQHEGLTMDRDGILYVVSENGGGDIDHPQLWVYAPSALPNQAPIALTLTNTVNSIAENTSTVAAIKVSDILVADDGLGTNVLNISGTDAAFFEITGGALYLKAGTVLDYETKTNYSINVEVDDLSVGTTPDATNTYSLAVTDVLVETTNTVPSLIISEVAPWSSGNSPVATDWFEVSNTGTNTIDITGWKMDDGSATLAAAALLNGVTNIAPGESVVFIETANLATTKAIFLSNWFGANPPATLQVGGYTGGSLSLSTSGDGVCLFDTNGTLQARVVFGTSPVGPKFGTFDNAAGLNGTNVSLTRLSIPRVHGAFIAANNFNEIGSPGSIGGLTISEVAAFSSGSSPVAADWFEVINTSPIPINITGWKIDDGSKLFASAALLNGITNIAPGEAVIFIETASPVTASSNFLANWFGASPPAGLQIGNYTGTGLGLSTGGDGVNLFDSIGTLRASVSFGASPLAAPFTTFDNSFGLNNAAISQLSAVGAHSAFVAVNSPNEIGSPGTGGKIVISEVAPWASSGSPLGADWFELSNTGSTPVDLTGWKMDDNSQSPVGAVALAGISSIAPGESVIFIETNNLAGARTAYLSNWFGANPPAGLQIGNYTGSGVGLSSGGDAVNIYSSNDVLQASVSFGASPVSPFATFDNGAGVNGAAIAQLSAVGTNGAFVAVSVPTETGSPGIMTVPSLALTVLGTDGVLRWTVEAVGYRLEETPSLTPASWANMPGTVLTNGQLGATASLTNDVRFFRLRK